MTKLVYSNNVITNGHGYGMEWLGMARAEDVKKRQDAGDIELCFSR